MAYYSFVVVAPQPIGFPKPLLILDQGVNVFSAEVANVEEFLQSLRAEGIEVREVNRLDEFEPTKLTDLLIDGAPLNLLGENLDET